MHWRNACGLAALAVLGMLAAVLTGSAIKPTPLVLVVVAREDVPAYTPLRGVGARFKLMEYKKGEEPPDAFTDIDSLEGQRLRRAVVVGEPVLKSDVLPESMQFPPPVQPKGTRALAVKIEPGIAGFVRPGNRVDVFVVSAKSEKETTCRMVLEDVLVLARDEAREDIPATATVAVTEEQAKKLAEAVKAGEIHLTVRPPEREQPTDKLAGLIDVPKGMRALAVKDNPAAQHGFIVPGQRVDVIVMKVKPGDEITAEMLLQDLLVLGTASTIDRDEKDPPLCGLAIIAVPNDQVEKVIAGTSRGTTMLLLRSPTPGSKLFDWRKTPKEQSPPEK